MYDIKPVSRLITFFNAYSNSLVLYPGFILTMIKPTLAVAYCVRIHSSVLGPHIPTRSPFLSPKDKNPAANRSTCKMTWKVQEDIYGIDMSGNKEKT